MVSKRKTLIILILFVIAITGLRLTFLHYQNPPAQPRAAEGVLDLRGWTIPDNRTLTLNGEWEFTPSRFIQPESLSAGSPAASASFIQVPGAWEQAFKESTDSPYRYGTYRLRILMDDNSDETYKLRVNRINHASAFYVNGQLAFQNGLPSENQDPSKTRVNPYSVTLPSGGGTVEIIIHVSGHAGNGGLTESIRFGTEKAVNQLNLLSVGLQVGLCVVFLIHGIYAAMLFLFRVASRGLLYFSLIMLMGMMTVLVADEKLLFVWFPMPYEYHYKIAILSYIAVVAFIPPLFRHMFDAPGKIKKLRWFTVYSACYALFLLISPARYIETSLILLGLGFLFSVIDSGKILIRAFRKNEDVIYVLIGLTALGVNILWTIAEGRFDLEWIHYPFDLAFAVFAFAAFWFKRFFRANAQTKRLADELRRANRQKDDFLVSTSHELRNPLHGILNITHSVLEDPSSPLPDEHRNRLEIQIAVARRMSFMLDDLIDITRLKESTIRLQPGNVHLLPVVNGVADVLRFMLDGKPIALHIDVDGQFPKVRADENRLAQILFNLMHNAIKFTDAGTIAVLAELKHGLAHIHIKDTGIGMDEETRNRIFAPYEQGDSERIKAVGGFGLGLSIAKQLVDLHGGTLDVVSSPGQGSVFTFTLPLAVETDDEASIISSLPFIPDAHSEIAAASVPSDEPERSSKTAAEVPWRSAPRLLIVDDDPVNLRILEDMLCTWHYDVTTAAGASEALAELETAQFDLVISDVMMPHISGYEFTRLARQRFSVSELPILLLTARSRPEDLYAGFRAGANDYAAKPVDAWELKSRIRSLIDLKLSFEERLRMEAAWLQAQIRPHFLFNTMNSIAALGAMDVGRMQRLLETFSHYLRTCFDYRNADKTVAIDRELSLVRSYLYIERERFGERLNVQWELDESLHFLVPPLSIQTLVENAVNHGLLPQARGGTIHIRIASSEQHIEVSVRDDGAGMSESALQQVLEAPPSASMGIGIRNTDRRLRQLYGAGLQLHSTLGEGTTASFKLPKHQWAAEKKNTN
ncbi:ATP-binding protein [Paenibacillus soyae]|uniref:histidine kinase n=1 Tax=Paenibacillus soyae TaxID=2969249 RepID=A0A9X2MSU3_9BACL|nr:ATP-binding protein [Paenibacillus soyae]MCR2805800.1 ATP-binding protein [Paenibacillus soyae]